MFGDHLISDASSPRDIHRDGQGHYSPGPTSQAPQVCGLRWSYECKHQSGASLTADAEDYLQNSVASSAEMCEGGIP